MNYPEIKRRPDVLKRLKVSRTTLYAKIDEGVWPTPIQLGARAVGWISSENEQVIAAMIAGQSQEQIQQLVQELMKQRKELFKGIA